MAVTSIRWTRESDVAEVNYKCSLYVLAADRYDRYTHLTSASSHWGLEKESSVAFFDTPEAHHSSAPASGTVSVSAGIRRRRGLFLVQHMVRLVLG